MPEQVLMCSVCKKYMHTVNDKIPRHEVDGEVCEGSGLEGVDEYPVGRDSDPWVYNGGLPELGKGR